MNKNGQQQAMTVAAGNGIARQDFGGQQMQSVAETAALAMAAQGKAAVEARYILAMRNRRDWDDVRTRLLRDCQRPAFAAVARYNKPIGDGIIGPSIRFAEAALRAMTNVLPETLAIYDDDDKRIIRVQVTDLEANLTYVKDVVLAKTVERSYAGDREVLSQRLNSKNKTVYVCRATEDELINKQAALESKALRSLALRLLPGDILDECMWTVAKVASDETAKDPDAERKRLASAFDALNVSARDLAQYLGHEIGKATPAEINEMRTVWATLNDGECTWQDALAFKLEQRGEVPADAGGAAKESKGVAALKAEMADRKKKSSAPPAEPAATEAAAETPAEPSKEAPKAESPAPTEKKAAPAPKAEKPKPKPKPKASPPEDVEGPRTCKDCGTPVEGDGTPAEGGGTLCEGCAS